LLDIANGALALEIPAWHLPTSPISGARERPTLGINYVAAARTVSSQSSASPAAFATRSGFLQGCLPAPQSRPSHSSTIRLNIQRFVITRDQITTQ